MLIVVPNVKKVEEDKVSFTYYNNVVYSNLDTSSHSAWNAAKTDYKIEDIVYNPALKREYICGVDGSRATPWKSSEWKDIGAENRYLMHDQTLFTKTEHSEDIEVHYQTRYETYLTIFSMENITSLEIEQRTLGTDELIEAKTVSLRDYGVDNFVEYCYTETTDRRNYAVEIEGDRPSILKVKFVGIDTRKVGSVIVGSGVDYGCVYTGSKVKTENLSKFVDNGLVTYFKGKGVVKRLSGSLSVPSARAEALSLKLDGLSGNLNAFWLNDDVNLQEAGMVLGYSNDYSLPIDSKGFKEIDFEIVGIK